MCCLDMDELYHKYIADGYFIIAERGGFPRVALATLVLGGCQSLPGSRLPSLDFALSRSSRSPPVRIPPSKGNFFRDINIPKTINFGERGIRTPEGFDTLRAFQARALGRYATSPGLLLRLVIICIIFSNYSQNKAICPGFVQNRIIC